MKLINRDMDYAIRTLCCMAKNIKTTVSAKTLSYNTGIPRPFIRKILQHLNKKSIVLSSKGKTGGFVLSRNPENICVMDIINAFNGGVVLMDHVLVKKRCANIKRCLLRKKVLKIENYIKKELSAISIKSLIKGIA
jgi:Rrf2 family protein